MKPQKQYRNEKQIDGLRAIFCALEKRLDDTAVIKSYADPDADFE